MNKPAAPYARASPDRPQRPCENVASTLPQTALRQHFFQDAVGDSVPARRTRLAPS